jgi:hypothetical protein
MNRAEMTQLGWDSCDTIIANRKSNRICTIMTQVLGITGLPVGVECAFVQRQLREICRLSHAWAVPGAACRPAAVNSLFSP